MKFNKHFFKVEITNTSEATPEEIKKGKFVHFSRFGLIALLHFKNYENTLNFPTIIWYPCVIIMSGLLVYNFYQFMYLYILSKTHNCCQ